MELPGADSVLVEEVKNKGIITLNRPNKLNAVHYEMADKVYIAVKKWQRTKSLIVIKGSGKAFCAGSDLKKLTDPREFQMNMNFFKVEYTLNHMIANLDVPYVSLIDGVIMGGGVGYSIHGRYRVATERTIFAMPETVIGAFPDIGASYFLPRLQRRLGYYLGLTGSRLHGADVLHAGIATHYCESKQIAELEQALINLEDVNTIEDVLSEFCPKIDSKFSLAEHLDQINECFDASTVEEILDKLEKDGTDWAMQTIKTLRSVSPTSSKLTLHQLRLGENYSLSECLQMEYRMVYRIMKCSDFHEGVTAVLIRKDNAPKWDPARIEDIVHSKHIMPFFEPLPDNDKLPI